MQAKSKSAACGVFVGWMLLNLYVSGCYGKDTLDFLVRQRCPSSSNNWLKHAATAYVRVGCHITFICRYSHESRQCQEEGFESELSITAPHNVSLRGQGGTKYCTLTRQISNVTVSHEGLYHCTDTARGYDTRELRLRVGSPPSIPRNLTVVYRPHRSLRLLLDKVKTGEELNDNSARWKVTFHWRIEPVECFPVEGKLDHGLYIACHVDLNKRYSGYDHYDGLGSVFNIVSFRVDVISVFGNTTTLKEAYIPHYVEPGSLYNVSVEDTGPTWIQLRVPLPLELDRNICNAMDNDSALRIHYSVKNLEEEEQQSLRSHTKHSFYRNLQDDKEAHKSLLLGNVNLEQARTVRWTNRCEKFMAVNITDLQPFTFYNITLTPKARYTGPSYTAFFNTSERAPLEGPKFDRNFYTCVTSSPTTPEYVKCYIYFREIPRPRRGGNIQNHTLRIGHFNVSVGGQDNVFVVGNLTSNIIYHVELQAFTQNGSSSVTTNNLTTSLSQGPYVVVVRKELGNGVWNYNVTWKPQVESMVLNNESYVHYCFVLDSLNCTTNMVINNVTQRESVKFEVNINRTHDREPFFFVSSELAASPHSLTPASCLYDESQRSPDSPDLDLTVQNNRLLLKMTPRCQTNYKHRQPTQFCYAVKETDDCKDCKDITEEACMVVRDHEVSRIVDLKPNRAYCVAVSAKDNKTQHPKWACQIARTQGVADTSFILSLVAVVVSTLFVVAVLTACILICVRCRRRYLKLQRKLNSQTHRFPQRRLPQTHRLRTEHTQLRIVPGATGETPLQRTTGIQNQRRIETDERSLFVNEQAAASVSTSPCLGDAGVCCEPKFPTRYALAPLPLHIDGHTREDDDEESTERSEEESSQDGQDTDEDDDYLPYAYDSELSASSWDNSESQASDRLDTNHDEEVGKVRAVGPAGIAEGLDKDENIIIGGDKEDNHEVKEMEKECLKDLENWPMHFDDDDLVLIASRSFDISLLTPRTLTAQTLQTCSSGHNEPPSASQVDEVADLENGNLNERLSTNHSVKTHPVKPQEHSETQQQQNLDNRSSGENADSLWNLSETLFPGPGVVSDCVSKPSQTEHNNVRLAEEATRGCTDSESVHNGRGTGCRRPWTQTPNHVFSGDRTIACFCKDVEKSQNDITDKSLDIGDGTPTSDSQERKNVALKSDRSKDEPMFLRKSHLPGRSALSSPSHVSSDITVVSCDITNMYDEIDLEEVSESSELFPKLCNGLLENIAPKHEEKAQFLPNHRRSSNYLKIHSDNVSS